MIAFAAQQWVNRILHGTVDSAGWSGVTRACVAGYFEWRMSAMSGQGAMMGVGSTRALNEPDNADDPPPMVM